MDINKQNIILTGPPRSGTTLTCHLLNQLDQTIALHEPMRLKMFPDKETALGNIDNFFAEMRQSLLSDGTAISKVKAGKIPDNPFGKAVDGVRHSQVTKGRVQFEKALNTDFMLVMKHNGHYSFMLKELVDRYPCFAIIRNPLATLASWQTISAPVAQGNLKVLRFLSPSIYDTLNQVDNVLDRQIALLHALFGCYEKLNTNHVIAYEDIVESEGRALHPIVPAASLMQAKLSNKNKNPLYKQEQLSKIASNLTETEGPIWNYYNRQEVWDLL
jgi:hypothetical protein